MGALSARCVGGVPYRTPRHTRLAGARAVREDRGSSGAALARAGAAWRRCGMSSTELRTSIDNVLERAVEAGAVPNVAAIAADRDGVIYAGAAGPRVAGQAEPVSVDSHFRIMSMTKMVATVAALQLAEQGVLDLDAPVERYCPEWARVQVLEGFDGDVPRLRAPATQATV